MARASSRSRGAIAAQPALPVMLILRGVRNQLDEEPALRYANRRGFVGRVLDVSGETGANSAQTREALKALRADPNIVALYGFSGGGYNVHHIINALSEEEKNRLRLVVVLGAPSNPASLYAGPWELVYRLDPPAGHMAGPQALLEEDESQSKKPSTMPVSKIWRGDDSRRVAKSLLALYDQINAFAPNRDQSSDGTIGNEEHAARASDHNPDSNGVVKAIDISHDPFHGVDTYAMADQLRISRDRRIRYLISNHRICGSEAYAASNGGTAWQWGHYSGSNPHDHHMHVSASHDEALYDDVAPWLVHPTDTHGEPVPAGDVKLKKGDTGAAVSELQRLLGMTGDDVDGRFGSKTDAAVRAFQGANGLFVDGIVGRSTWAKLRAGGVVVAQTSGTAPSLPQDTIARIAALAGASDLARYSWPDKRGVAPRGYIKGMAVSFAHVYANWKAGDSSTRVMAALPTGDINHDALAWYGVTNITAGASTLRALFSLLIGLGMRESSGNCYEGRDTSAKNFDADTVEAGLFQQSWNSRVASAELPKLLATWRVSSDDGFLSIFREGLSGGPSQNFGSGDGAVFQALCKSKPLFSVYCAAVGLRVIGGQRPYGHWGPIRERAAEMRPEAAALLLQVQAIVDAITQEKPMPDQPNPLPQPPGTGTKLDIGGLIKEVTEARDKIKEQIGVLREVMGDDYIKRLLAPLNSSVPGILPPTDAPPPPTDQVNKVGFGTGILGVIAALLGVQQGVVPNPTTSAGGLLTVLLPAALSVFGAGGGVASILARVAPGILAALRPKP